MVTVSCSTILSCFLHNYKENTALVSSEEQDKAHCVYQPSGVDSKKTLQELLAVFNENTDIEIVNESLLRRFSQNKN